MDSDTNDTNSKRANKNISTGVDVVFVEDMIK
jgi:hypothetical protein